MNQLPFRGSQINKTHPLSKGLIGCWLFNENNDSYLHDSSYNNSTGFMINCIWSEGLDFNGTNSYVKLPNLNVGGFDEFSILLWVKAKSVTSDGFVLGNWGTSYNFAIYADNHWTGDGWRAILRNAEPRDFNSPIIVNPVVLNEWTLLVITYRRNDYHRFYVNGIEVFNVATTDYPMKTYTDEPRLGGDINNGRFFNGSIKYVLAYNRAISSEEITQLKVNPYGMFESQISSALLYHATAAGVPNTGAMLMMLMR